MRDIKCDESKLSEGIKLNIDFIKENIKEIHDLENDLKNNIQRYVYSNESIISKTYCENFNYSLENICSKYSNGVNISELLDDYSQAIEFINLTHEEIGYFRILWMISIGILLETNQKHFEILYEKYKQNKYNDYLILYLLYSVGIIDKIDENRFYKNNPYSYVKDIILLSAENTDKAKKALKDYVEKKWLKGHKDYGWTNFHKEPGYVGLWSFEAAALSKILNIDDEALKGNNHYPYDLRHYKNSMEFKQLDDFIENTVTINKSKGLYSPIIPDQFYNEIEELKTDYKTLSNLDFYNKYNLKDLCFIFEDYENENKNRDLLGFIIINYLVEKQYIMQLDYKENIKDYIDDLENYWDSQDVKLVKFNLNNDQNYYAYVLKSNETHLCEIEIEDVKLNKVRNDIER